VKVKDGWGYGYSGSKVKQSVAFCRRHCATAHRGVAGTGSRCKIGLLDQKPEVEIFWREIQKLVMGLFKILIFHRIFN